jgi:hypothetical protein
MFYSSISLCFLGCRIVVVVDDDGVIDAEVGVNVDEVC